MALSKGNKSRSYMGGSKSGNEIHDGGMVKNRRTTNDKSKASPVPMSGGHGKMHKAK